MENETPAPEIPETPSPETTAEEVVETPETPPAAESVEAATDNTAPTETPKEPDAEPVKEAVRFDAAGYRKAMDDRKDLSTQQEDLDKQIADLESKIESGEIDPMEAGNKLTLLNNKQSRLDRKIAALDKSIQGHQDQQKASTDSQWKTLAREFPEVADTPEDAEKVLKDIWADELAKVDKSKPGASDDYRTGFAQARWEHRINVLRAKSRATPREEKARTPVPDSRLTPRTSSPSPSRPESAAEKVRRTMGPLANWQV